MKTKLLSALLGALVASAPFAFADDSQMLRRSISSSPGQTAVPEPEGEHAYVQLMNFYVPSQNSAGEPVPVEYYNIDEALVKTEEKAKPLVSFYLYGPVNSFDDFSQSGFPGHGLRDAYAAVSLDDGLTWKRTNLSNSADKSSFTLDEPVLIPGADYLFEVSEDGPVIEQASLEATRRGGDLTVVGDAGDRRVKVTIRNAVTLDKLFSFQTEEDGSFDFTKNVKSAPCEVVAEVGSDFGAPEPVLDAPADCTGQLGGVLTTAYPGDVTNGVHAVAGNRIMAAWQSKFCRGGSPVWGDTYPVDDVASYLTINNPDFDNLDDLYLVDLFDVAGSQGSVDYTEQEEFPGEYDDVGQVPYNCLWTARGVLRENPEVPETTEVVWFQAERLTSGKRDVNRIEVGCVAGAGCAVSWQEDPDGLRPGEGEGAGTGWAGATTNSQTEVWYSFIRWEDMAIVDVEGTPTPLADTILDTGRPQPYVPMMNAARLTNNARCQIPVTGLEESYCNFGVAEAYMLADFCADTTEIPLGPTGALRPVCVADSNNDGTADFVNVANTAASRPRLSVQPRDSDGDGITDDAWIIVFAEEDKGLGRFGYSNNVAWTGNLEDTGVIACDDPDSDREDDCVEADIGKNIMWYTFAMGTPDTSAGADADYSLVRNLVSQGAQLNQPEVNWRTGTFYPPMDTADMWDFGDYNYLIFNTEIARRSSHMVQSVAKAAASESGLIAFPLWKQGTLRQGGPADIMARRFAIEVQGGGACDAMTVEDEGGPRVSDVRRVSSEENPALQYIIEGNVAGLDGIVNTGFFLRNEENDLIFYNNNVPQDTSSFLANRETGVNGDITYASCCLQVSDESPANDDTPAGNWGEVWDLTDAWAEIGVQCGIDSQPVAEPDSVVQLASRVFTTEAESNPYDVSNMKCEWYDGEGGVFPGVVLFDPATDFNPYYPKGLCTAPAINLSARTPYECGAAESGGNSGADGVCTAENLTCTDSEWGQLCVPDDTDLTSTDNPENIQMFDKLISWYECPGYNGTNTATTQPTLPGLCGTEPASAALLSNLDDQSWYQPLEISKAHRGFLDGDFVMMMYAWSPNYKDNAVGRDRYELYARRSFDGGITWRTLDSFTGTDGISVTGEGTVACETWRDGDDSLTDAHVCTEYAAGETEQSRNVSQLKSTRTTILDPRYTPTIAGMGTECPPYVDEEVDGLLCDWLMFEPIDDTNTLDGDPTDVRNSSRYFLVYETGDNTTTEVGEAEPLDLFYGRAELYGDVYTVWTEIDTDVSTLDDCYPNNAHEDDSVLWAVGSGFCNEFDDLEGRRDSESGEASITSSAYGDFLYAVWAQVNFDPETGEEIDSDAMFRRVWYLDDYISTENAYTVPGTAQEGN